MALLDDASHLGIPSDDRVIALGALEDYSENSLSARRSSLCLGPLEVPKHTHVCLPQEPGFCFERFHDCTLISQHQVAFPRAQFPLPPPSFSLGHPGLGDRKDVCSVQSGGHPPRGSSLHFVLQDM